MGEFENLNYKSDCLVSSDRKKKLRCQTSYFCKQCNSLLSIVPYFGRYLSFVNYFIHYRREGGRGSACPGGPGPKGGLGPKSWPPKFLTRFSP